MRKLLVLLSVVFLITAAMAQSSLPTGTPLKVKLETTISTFSSHVGDPFQGRLIDAVVIDGKTLLPAGATVEGRVTKLNEPRRIKGKPTIALFPENVVLPTGERYMAASPFSNRYTSYSRDASSGDSRPAESREK